MNKSFPAFQKPSKSNFFQLAGAFGTFGTLSIAPEKMEEDSLIIVNEIDPPLEKKHTKKKDLIDIYEEDDSRDYVDFFEETLLVNYARDKLVVSKKLILPDVFAVKLPCDVTVLRVTGVTEIKGVRKFMLVLHDESTDVTYSQWTGEDCGNIYWLLLMDVYCLVAQLPRPQVHVGIF